MKKLQKIVLLSLVFSGQMYAEPDLTKDIQTQTEQINNKPLEEIEPTALNAFRLTMPSLPFASLLSPDVLHKATGYTKEELEEKLSLSKDFLQASIKGKAHDYNEKDRMLDVQKSYSWFRPVTGVCALLALVSGHFLVNKNYDNPYFAFYSTLGMLGFGAAEIRRCVKKNSLEKEVEKLKKQERCLKLIDVGASLEDIQKHIMQQEIEHRDSAVAKSYGVTKERA